MFKQMDLKGKSKDDSKLDTVHQNTITTIRVYEGSPGNVAKFSSKSTVRRLQMVTTNMFQRVVWMVEL